MARDGGGERLVVVFEVEFERVQGPPVSVDELQELALCAFAHRLVKAPLHIPRRNGLRRS